MTLDTDGDGTRGRGETCCSLSSLSRHHHPLPPPTGANPLALPFSLSRAFSRWRFYHDKLAALNLVTSLNHRRSTHMLYTTREEGGDAKVATRARATKKRRVRGHLSLLDNLYEKLRSTTFNFHEEGKKAAGKKKRRRWPTTVTSSLANHTKMSTAVQREGRRRLKRDASRESFSSRSFTFSSFREIRRVIRRLAARNETLVTERCLHA